MLMRLGLNGEALIKRFEQLRLTAYQDERGIWTIGWGHTKDVRPGDVIGTDMAQGMFAQDTQDAAYSVIRLVRVPLSQDQFDALVSFTFNLGAPALESSTLLKLLNAGNAEAAAQQFIRWDHEGPVEVAGLLRRRAAERDLFLKV